MSTRKCKKIVILATLFGNFAPLCFTQESVERPCSESLAKPLFNYTVLPNGSLIADQLTYSPQLYWVDYEKNMTYGCVCSLSKACTRKCCRAGEVLQEKTCVASEYVEGSSKILQLRNELLDPDLWMITKLDDAFNIVEGMIECPEGFNRVILDPEHEDDVFVLQKNGILKMSSTSYSVNEYCLDWTDYMKNCSAVICIAMSIDTTESAYPIGMLISVVFLLLTFLVYAIVPELHNLHGKTLMCHMATLIVAYTGLVILKADYSYLMSNHSCHILGA